MTIDEKRQLLQSEMNRQVIDYHLTNNLAELCYTASETGVLPFTLSGDDLMSMVRLIKVAEQMGDNRISDDLRM